MRLALALIAVSFFAAPAAQEPREIPPLERIIARNIILRPADDHCLVPSLVRSIARDVGMAAGVEYLPGACDYRRSPNADPGSWVPLIGMSVREALDTLKDFDPRYHWIESDGVILMRPLEAWGDEKHPLHEPIGEFSADEEHAAVLAHRLNVRLTGARGREPWEFSPRTAGAAQPLTFMQTATTPILVLDAIVRTHGAASWSVRWCRSERRLEFVRIGLSGHDGWSASAASFNPFDFPLGDPCRQP